MIERAIRQILLTAATAAADRIYPIKMPQDQQVFPVIVYQRISTVRGGTLGERGDGVATPRIQVRSWHQTYDGAKLLNEQVRNAVGGYQNASVVIGSGPEAYDIQSIALDDEGDDYDEEMKLYGVITDIIVWHTEAAPS